MSNPANFGDDRLPARFWSKVAPPRPDGCWLWTGTLNLRVNGYGRFYWCGRPRYAHRIAYEAFVRPIPDGLEMDHLCRVPRCVPDHLEAVTHRTNSRRGMSPSVVASIRGTCSRGHLLPDQPDTTGKRRCKECMRENSRQAWPDALQEDHG